MSSYRSGLRETQADFELADFIAPGLSTTRRPGALSFDYLTAFSLGPKDIGDPSEGAVDRPWYVRVDSGNVFVARANDGHTAWEAEVLLFTVEGDPILEVDLAFDQNARLVICAERLTGEGGTPEVWLYWYNPSLADFVFELFGPGWSPRALLDNPPDPSDSDILIFLFREGEGLIYLQQRDLYAVSHSTPVTSWEGRYLEEVLYVKWDRMVCVYSVRSSDETYTLDRLESTLLPHLTPNDDKFGFAVSLIEAGSELADVYIDFEQYPEDFLGQMLSILSGSLNDPVLTIDAHVDYLPDLEALTGSLDLLSGELGQPILFHDMSSGVNESLEVSLGLLNTGSLAVVVISHTQYQEDSLEYNLNITGGSLAVP